MIEIGHSFTKMAVGLAVLGLLRALTIDNQLTVIKNDCYERLAIGQRLNPKDVYQSLSLNTVPDCQMACTKEQESCRSFSFGIGVKGNATCELSAYAIKETHDLKPIGTKADTDFDLYIKKLGCKLVITKNPAHSLPPVSDKPPIPNPPQERPPLCASRPDCGLPGTPNFPYGPPRPPLPSYDTYPSHNKPNEQFHHVQTTLISIRPEPTKPGNYGNSRPQGVNNRPYPLDDGYNRPDRPIHPDGDHNYGSFRPQGPGFNDDGYGRPGRPPQPGGDHNYGNIRPQGLGFKPYPLDDGYDRPDLPPYSGGNDNYGSIGFNQKPHPLDDGYGRPDRPSRPGGDHNYGNSRPHDLGYDRPDPPPSSGSNDNYGSIGFNQKPHPLDDGYGRPDRPSRPGGDHNYGNSRPQDLGYDRPDPLPYPDHNYGPPRPGGDHNYGSSSSQGFNNKPHPLDGGYDRPNQPSRPASLPFRPEPYDPGFNDKPFLDDRFGYDRPDRPSRPKPLDKPYESDESRPQSYIPGPHKVSLLYNSDRFYAQYSSSRPDSGRPGYEGESRPPAGEPENYGSGPYVYNKPISSQKPYLDPTTPATEANNYGSLTSSRPGDLPSDPDNPNAGGPSNYPGGQSSNQQVQKPYGENAPKDPHNKPIVTQIVGPHGETITSIITELSDACFRRVLAGKRVLRSFVRKVISCERVEDCQQECADEKRFVCEGFNYRLDPANRGRGECELLDLPLSHLDIGRDLYPDRNFDYYERDRNSSPNCREGPSGYLPRPIDRYDDRDRFYYGGNNHRFPGYGGGRPKPRPYDDRYQPHPVHRGDYDYHYSHHSQDSQNYHYHYTNNHDRDFAAPPYLPDQPPKRKPERDQYWVKYFDDREKDRNYWKLDQHRNGWGSYGGQYGNFGGPEAYYNPHFQDGQHNNHNRYDVDHHRNQYVPQGIKDWGRYGGSYGHQNQWQDNNKSSFDFWGFNQIDRNSDNSYHGFHGYIESPPYIGRPPTHYLPPGEKGYGTFGYSDHSSESHNSVGFSGSFQPPKLHNRQGYNFLKDECSLRTATGFRIHKGIVKKFFAVPNIYECELLCFNEKDFRCTSYAFRYTISLSAPTDNCYLSDQNYKELDYYTDLEPDRDFDVYTMNNHDRCSQPMVVGKDSSDCFWRVRSGHRLENNVIKDSLNVKSIVECQIECLRSTRFTCRGFSFRYGSPVIGGPIDNCQLTDCPFVDLEPRRDFVREPGYEVYERGSYGHGCEPHHFNIGRKPVQNNKADEICYVGYGSPARLLPQATKKSLVVETELDCKKECSRTRENTVFQCMSFSFVTSGPPRTTNCYLSDILQRDLLSDVDYVYDPNSWLFAWDNYNPKCIALAEERVNDPNGGDLESRYDPLDTWRVYSVSGYPCRRGSLCQENREAGFWFCELEGRDSDSWDYCCRPDHQCGYSKGFPYEWCYVGPAQTQWRKCSDRYYPYYNYIDRIDHVPKPPRPWLHDRPGSNYVDNLRPPGFRPDRPPAPVTQPPPRPTLDEYEAEFDNQFLDPPKPGGFGQPRHWPVSYLHKEMPPNATVFERTFERIQAQKTNDSNYDAITNLINSIKSNDPKRLQYQILNNSNNADDILFVRIPLPTNFSRSTQTEKLHLDIHDIGDLETPKKNNTSLTLTLNNDTLSDDTAKLEILNKIRDITAQISGASSRVATQETPQFPVYRRSYITKANRTELNRRRAKSTRGHIQPVEV